MRRRKTYSVEPTGRSGFIYREGDQSVSVFSEFLSGDKYDMVAYLSRVDRWDSPEDAGPLTDEDRERIKKNVTAALRVNIEWA